MADLRGFNATEIEPTTFDLLPAGDYNVAIVDSVEQVTKKGDGKMLVLQLDVLDGSYRGRKLWERLNLWNPSPDAVKIAKATLSAICRATGVLTPSESSDLYGLPMVATVKIKTDPQWGDSNVIKGYSRRSGAADLVPPPGQPAPQDEIPF